MSAVAAVRYLLATNAALLAEVPATRIVASHLRVGTTLPAINIAQVSGVERLTGGMHESSRLRVERVQVTVHTGSYPAQKEILELVRSALVAHPGAVNGITVDSILPDGEGPDLSQPDAAIFEQSRDFVVTWLT